MKHNTFFHGIKDGFPIFLSYLSVAFAFGIFACSSGFKPTEAILMSMTNLTSAGQLAAVPIIAGGGTLIELAVCQFFINLRYSLMSISLSQKFDKDIKLRHRFFLAFFVTDEIFAVSSVKAFDVSKQYMYGIISTPYFGWAIGTAIGAFAGNVLPAIVVSALGVAIYGMFVALVMPYAKSDRPTLYAVLIAMALGLILYYVPLLCEIPAGFKIILCSVIASSVMAVIKPLGKEAAPNE